MTQFLRENSILLMSGMLLVGLIAGVSRLQKIKDEKSPDQLIVESSATIERQITFPTVVSASSSKEAAPAVTTPKPAPFPAVLNPVSNHVHDDEQDDDN